VIQSLLLDVCFEYGRAWTRVQLICTGRVELRRVDRLYWTRDIKWWWDEQADLTWTIKPVLTEDELSLLTWLEQSNQCWLKTCWASLTWTVKRNGLSMLDHQASSLLRRIRLFFIRLTPTSPQSIKRQAC